VSGRAAVFALVLAVAPACSSGAAKNAAPGGPVDAATEPSDAGPGAPRRPW
jgi:hypothetical protein